MAVLNTRILDARCCRPQQRITFDKMHTIGDDKAWILQLLKNVCGASSILLPCKRCSSRRIKKQNKKKLHIDWGKLIMNSVQKRKGKSGFGLACDVLLFTIPFIFSVITACYATASTGPFNCSRSRNAKTAFMAPVVCFFSCSGYRYRARWGIAQRIINK